MMDIDKKMSALHDLRIMNEDTLQNLQNNVPSTSDVIVAEAASLQQKITAVFTEVGTSIENLIENPTLEKAIELQQKIEKMPETLCAIPLVDSLE